MCKSCDDANDQYTERMFEPSKNKMIIVVDAGVVTVVEGGPDDLRIEVWDYDVVGDGDSINIDGDPFKLGIIRE